MIQKEFERLKFLSEKTFTDLVTLDELKEFNELLTDFSVSEDFSPRTHIERSRHLN